MDRIRPNFLCTFSLILCALNVFFFKFATELQPLIDTGVKLDGKSIWKIHMDFFFENLFFLICSNTYEL